MSEPRKRQQEPAGAPEIREDLLAAGGEIEGPRDPEAREMAALTRELSALDEDIAAARAASQPARGGLAWHRADEPPPPSLHGERVELADGGEILIRAIEPGDALALESGLEHLSAMSRYRRFRAPVERYSSRELEWLTHVDHLHHEALVALDPDARIIVGVARYVCEPADRSRAHVTYVVADAWQHRGVGSALIKRLGARARAGGVECLVARTLVDDDRARHLLAHIADELDEHREGGVAEITARLREPLP